MQQVIYSMRFTGQAAPVEGSEGMLKATTSSPSCSITSTVGPGGVRGTIAPIDGDTATFESEVTFTGDGVFQEQGTIRFGPYGHLLRFSTVGEGRLGASADPTLQSGTVMWRVDSGEGQFAEASGFITSNFTVGEAGEVADHHFGVIFVP